MLSASDDMEHFTNVIYVSRIFGAWYVAYSSFQHLIASDTTGDQQLQLKKLLIDAKWAFNQSPPPIIYKALHYEIAAVFEHTELWLSGNTEQTVIDLMEDLQIVGVKLKQQLILLGIDHTL